MSDELLLHATSTYTLISLVNSIVHQRYLRALASLFIKDKQPAHADFRNIPAQCCQAVNLPKIQMLRPIHYQGCWKGQLEPITRLSICQAHHGAPSHITSRLILLGQPDEGRDQAGTLVITFSSMKHGRHSKRAIGTSPLNSLI